MHETSLAAGNFPRNLGRNPFQIAADGFSDDQTIRSDAHDSKTALPYAGTRADERNAFCESAVQLRHLIDRVGKGIVRDGLANATEPSELVFLIVLS
jgi:hypothetical protein